MAKVSYGKLDLKLPSTKTFTWNDAEIEVIQYLPIEKKIEMFENILNASVDDKGYINPTKVKFNLELNIVFTYTNVSFTEKQKEDIMKLYDKLKGSGFIDKVIDTMNDEEYMQVFSDVWDTMRNIYEYNRSALGVITTISEDYSNLNFETEEIQKNLSDPNNLKLVKDIMTKLG